MRITANTFPISLRDQLSRLAVRQYQLQNQAATGQRLTLPQDDPTAMRRVLDMQGEAKSLGQYQRNIDRHSELATASYGAMQSLKKVVDRAGEITTLADGLKSPAELTTYATELNEMIKQAVQLANTRNRGDYIFSGTRSDQQAFVATTDAGGLITSVAYQGNESIAESEISQNVTITSQALGSNNSGNGPRGLLTDSRSGADLFNHLISLRDNLLAGNTDAINSTNHAQIAADEENLLYHFGTNGSVQSRLETTAAIGRKRGDSLEGLISKESDADLAQTLLKFHETQTAYQAAMQSSSMILQNDLLDYIR